eukprot:TRINITY_DN15837_c0_g2_i2.p1 TRINITY_DN15837_c0_g2~~TRINITY_DN15837_c0_g2_i2.p1  ORF type:complete len:222 (-),score=63.66 TRINITY_DN15837_c0_g2_i2:173-838(-)
MDFFNTMLTLKLQDLAEADSSFILLMRSSIMIFLTFLIFAVSILSRMISAHHSQTLIQGRTILLRAYESAEGTGSLDSDQQLFLQSLIKSRGNSSSSPALQDRGSSLVNSSSSPPSQERGSSLAMSHQINPRSSSNLEFNRTLLLSLSAQRSFKERSLEKLIHDELYAIEAEALQTCLSLTALQEACLVNLGGKDVKKHSSLLEANTTIINSVLYEDDEKQ